MTEGCVLITGCNSGIGLEIARTFYENGRDVVLTCRSEQKANFALENIKKTSSNVKGQISYMLLDLSSLTSVQNFVKEFKESDKKLQILINNAGVALKGKGKSNMKFSEDGYELTVATNHIGPFLLTNSLLDCLKEGHALFGDARIVNVASSVHDYDTVKMASKPFDINNMFLDEGNTYDANQAYSNSKYMTVLFTYGLARRLGENNVTATCLCPGFIPSTGLFKEQSFLMKPLFNLIWYSTGKATTQLAASHVLNMATSKEFARVTGKYFINSVEKQSQKNTYNEELQDELWSITEELIQAKE